MKAGGLATTRPAPEAEYRRLRDLGAAAIDRGDWGEAHHAFEAASSVAAGLPRHTRDLAHCNLAGIEIHLGVLPSRRVPQLRELVTRGSAEARRLAAYHLAHWYQTRMRWKLSRFYLRQSLLLAERLRRRDWIASSHNLLGNQMVARGRIERAIAEYSLARDFLEVGSSRQAQAMCNIAYCHYRVGHAEKVIESAETALRIFERRAVRTWLPEVHTLIATAYLETGRLALAQEHGHQVLATATEMDDAKATRNGLFVLGETACRRGDAESARRRFRQLQRRFYPEQQSLPDFLMAVDVWSAIDLIE